MWPNGASEIKKLAQMHADKTNNDNDGDDDDDYDNNNDSSCRYCKQRTQKQMFYFNTTVYSQNSSS